MTTTQDIRQTVSERYAGIARSAKPSCCGGDKDKHAELIGYTPEQLAALPEGANLGLGCGNPTSLAMIEPGMTVLDLGSGAGVDCFLAAAKVGPTGRVVGVDMTDAMLDKARDYAAKHGYANVEFRKGFIEQLPVPDASVDLIISNCVINLSPDKAAVFREIARVLKPGGRAAVSDIVLLQPLPEAVKRDVEAYIGCIAGAELVGDYLGHAIAGGLEVQKAQRKGYDVVSVLGCSPEASKLIDKLPANFDGNAHVASLDLVAVKPGKSCCDKSTCCK